MDAGQIMLMPAATQAAGMQLAGASQIDLAAKNSGFDQLLTSVVQETQKQDVLLPEKDAGSAEVDFDLKRQEQNGMTLDPAILQMMASLFATPDAHISTAVNSAETLAADAMPVGVIAEVEVQPQTKVEVQPQTKVEVQPQTKVEVQPQAKVEVQPQAKVEVQPQAKVEVQPQAKVEVQPQTKVEVQPQAKVEVQPQAKVEVQPQAKVEVQPQTKVEVQPQAKVEVQPQAKVELQPQAKVEAEQTTKAPTAWLVYGRPVQMTHQATARQQALQVSGEIREAGSTPAILMSRATESEVVMPGLAVSSQDEAGMQHGQSEPGSAHQFGTTVQANLMAAQGHTGEALAADSEKTAVSEQVARQVVTHLKLSGREQGGDQSVTFRLSPEHLGDIQLSMHMDAKQGVKIEIVAENRGVRETLLQQADDLRETLARQNIKMDSFDVSTGLGGDASQQTRDWRQQVVLQQQSQRVAGVERNLFRETAEIPIRYIEAQYQSTLDVRF